MEPVVLAENSEFVFISKPPTYLSVPPSQKEDESSKPASSVLSHWVYKNIGPCEVVHRLDLETSGVIVFAKNKKSHQMVSLAFQNQEVIKVYRLITHSKLEHKFPPSIKVTTPVNGKPAKTLFSKISSVEVSAHELIYWEARIWHGRRHQIRIHSSENGFPVLGDKRYGQSPSHLTIPKRHALHAYSLKLPFMSEAIVSPLPEDFLEWIKSFGLMSRNIGKD